MSNTITKQQLTSGDRKLLERAAKAAGYWNWQYNCWNGEPHPEWDPINKDDQAFRLAVKLNMTINVSIEDIFVCNEEGIGVCEPRRDDPFAATRRAIVVAAAEIGAQYK